METSIGKIPDRVLKKYRNRVAYKMHGQEFMYNEVEVTVNELANGLLCLGLQKGDRVVMMTTNMD